MTDLFDNKSRLVVGDVVKFRSDLFFEGAVQLRWVDEDHHRAQRAATHFVFHGPRYHAVRREDAGDGYILRDTASFSADLVEGLVDGEQRQGNPFSLAIAGYGSGKSHLAVTLAELLSAPSSSAAEQIIENVTSADVAEGARLAKSLNSLGKPLLVVPLDGMTNFNLGSALTRSVLVKLRAAGCDLSAIEELSPRFKAAEQFVVRNFSLRRADFCDVLPSSDLDVIVALLREHDEATYGAVDAVFERANGTHIPVEGRESIQDLISTVTTVYCDSEGPFSGLVLLFDEFGRFLEYAAEQPRLAGDSALQQLFQGIQDSAGRAVFLGFIQYDIKAYVSRLDRRDLMHLQRYITRFETAHKSYLSTNLETLFAHLIQKKEPAFLKKYVSGNELALVHHLLLQALPEAKMLPVWSELEQFRDVICAGCWPLDPLAVWFLTRQQDVVQSRSALNIVKAAIERVTEQPALTGAGRCLSISAADLLLTDMLSEFVSAEQARGGTVAETLQSLLEERAAHLEPDDRRLLAAAAVLLKLRVRIPDQHLYERLISIASGLNGECLTQSLHRVVEILGVLEWNGDFGQYELIQDAATRGQFQRLLRSRIADPATKDVGSLYIAYARTLCNLQGVDPGFANSRGITTQDWRFEPIFSDSTTVDESIENAFKDWRYSADVNESKGRIIFTYVGAGQEIERVRSAVRAKFSSELSAYRVDQAPVWVSLLDDHDGRLAKSLQTWWVLERGLTDEDKERYKRFVSAEAERTESLARSDAERALSARHHEVAGFKVAPGGRLSKVGQEIFSVVYPEVVPFHFDGFSTGTGAGPTSKKDCLEIVRALVNGDADAEWIQSRVPRLRNRASQLLVHDWQVIDRDGSLAVQPGNHQIANILEVLDEWHQADPGRALEDSKRDLIAPPYGCNLASASLILGLFISRRWPRRRLLLNKESVLGSDWITKAFKTSDLDSKVLSQTTVAYIADDAQAHWMRLLERWRNATLHRERIAYREEARLLEHEGVVPEECLYQYERLVDQANRSKQAVASFEARFEKIQRDLESKFNRDGSLSTLAVCDQLIALYDEVNNGAWDSEEKESVEQLLFVVREYVGAEASRWIEREHCRSPQEVGDYRRKMEKATATLERLKLSELAGQVRMQKNQSIATVELRFKYQSALIEAQQFANVTTIGPETPIVGLKGILAQAKRFRAALSEASAVMREPELDEVLESLNRLEREANNSIAQHRADLQELYSTAINSLDGARSLQMRVSRARELFAGEPDLADIVDADRQLKKIGLDLETWDAMDGSSEAIKAQLSPVIEARCRDLDHWCEEEEVDPLWNFRVVYRSFCEQKAASAQERATLWVRSSIPTEHDIGGFSLKECGWRLEKLQGQLPDYLGTIELQEVDRACKALRRRVRELENENARAEALRWLEQFDGIDGCIDQLSKSSCESLLLALRARPPLLSEAEAHQVERLAMGIERQLDMIDVSDIVSRIRRLKPEALRKVLEEIEVLSEGR
ncbi:hypothetical protein LRB11_01525 [Ectothiorhodospira haloalkaliphila]|uniref:hypothetical protein n=1 Tax=Ectothiorhodospira haloalkaliphila TaxID=421628 RepID=UPI001EE82D21|nr:hypothetical protein [Ectothiorhodospira haloalkaliphila]MCG5523610.1 hypothetical protein [Ectothiorhodospira haloalkaliphila]